EKWLQSASGDWYFIKPDGALFIWDRTPLQPTGTMVAQLDPVYNVHPELLYAPPASDMAFALDQALGLNFTGDFSLNYGNQNEKWLLGNDGWYFIKPNGELWRWDGTLHQATGQLMATLATDYYINPVRLYSASPTTLNVDVLGTQLMFDHSPGFIGDVWITVK